MARENSHSHFGRLCHVLCRSAFPSSREEFRLVKTELRLALSSRESDVKALELRARAKDPRAILALDVFAVSMRKTIGAYAALLGGVDLLVFTGGVGENSYFIRSAATKGVEI